MAPALFSATPERAQLGALTSEDDIRSRYLAPVQNLKKKQTEIGHNIISRVRSYRVRNSTPTTATSPVMEWRRWHEKICTMEGTRFRVRKSLECEWHVFPPGRCLGSNWLTGLSGCAVVGWILNWVVCWLVYFLVVYFENWECFTRLNKR